MSGIRVRDNEGFDSAIRRFKRAVEKSGILSEVRRREFHETRSEKKKRARAAAVKRFRKKQLRDVKGGERGGNARGRAGRGGAQTRGGRAGGLGSEDMRGSSQGRNH